ncbi:electron transfer flavoprotein beta subunit/FixA family protein [candidate division NPL-UPA2 bacterium Unc8]|uniref:Electron transfer flavoprotein subunit beta n=1 Tax=candidate division NPL-UPA2 bacterium Unc8 TaxID=1980939 RepID=A0A399FZV9_UNCN2|nr:Electron transfer flavoprotein subunit beta [Bacillota bacterium]RII01006.1 MAG: electron transfer flavoprotein beta subunit/FixA family protein [candidate division NPL-UPA2 bacterium Unc8]
MDMIVCVKRVPETTEAELTIAEGGRSIKEERLVFDINEWDNYAVEEAILLKEKFGGSVIIIMVGSEAANETLRHCLAKGADSAVRLSDEAFNGSDGYAIARILREVIKDMKFDLLLTGVQSSDNGYGQIGVMLASMLKVPHATLVTSIEIKDKVAKVTRELEGGEGEALEIKLPAVLSIQTGINEPRYASIRGIRDAMKKEIKVLGLSDTGLSARDVGEAGSKTRIEELFIPEVGEVAEMLTGTVEEASGKLAEILKSKGLLG